MIKHVQTVWFYVVGSLILIVIDSGEPGCSGAHAKTPTEQGAAAMSTFWILLGGHLVPPKGTWESHLRNACAPVHHMCWLWTDWL